MLQFEGRLLCTKNPEAGFVIDFLNAELNLRLPSPTDDLVSPPRQDLTPQPRDADSRLAPLKLYAASEDGRKVLDGMARSIKLGHTTNPAVLSMTGNTSGCVAVNVGNACAIRIESRTEVRLPVVPEGVRADARVCLEADSADSKESTV